MQNNNFNYMQGQSYPVSAQNPNAVSINIFSPSAYGSAQTPDNSGAGQNVQKYSQNIYPNNFYPLYATNPVSQPVLYPQNYNNLINYPNSNQNYPNNGVIYPNPYNYMQNVPAQNQSNLVPGSNMINNEMQKHSKQDNQSDENSTSENSKTENKDSKSKEEKTVVPLTDDYIKSLENYLNSNNSKIRLTGIKEVINRFKEDENRKDNPSLIPLLNKALQDTSPSVRFLALTAIQLGYTKGNDETVALLNKFVENSKDNFGEDATLASEALLKIATPENVTIEGGN